MKICLEISRIFLVFQEPEDSSFQGVHMMTRSFSQKWKLGGQFLLCLRFLLFFFKQWLLKLTHYFHYSRPYQPASLQRQRQQICSPLPFHRPCGENEIYLGNFLGSYAYSLASFDICRIYIYIRIMMIIEGDIVS